MKLRHNTRGRILAFLVAMTVALTNTPIATVQAEEVLTDSFTEDEAVTSQKQSEDADDSNAPAGQETDTTNPEEIGQAREEQGQIQKSQDSQEEETQDTELSAMKYVVIAQPQVNTPDTQDVVIGLDESLQTATEAVLTYRNNTTGQVFEHNASKMIQGAILFSMEYTDIFQSGEYELLSVSCTIDGVEYTMAMSELNIDARYGVNQQVQTTPDGIVVEEPEEDGFQTSSSFRGASADASGSQDIDIVTMDGNGEVTSQNSIAEAIQAAEKECSSKAKSKELVVVLDPGHGGYDGGAQGNGLSEKNLNLAIATYCKAELEKYNNVKVYMTRTDDTYVGRSDRAALANSWGADVFVSIHVNSATPTATGAEVWYPNPTGNLDIHNEGAKLAQSIEDQLVALGLGNRGIHYRNYSYDWSIDQNIGDADYYCVIREAKAYGFPGVIVEHAFISNPNDAANFLGNDAALKKLGVADATGIAKAYGLTKEPKYTSKDTTVKAELNASQTEVTLKATGMAQASGVKFAVYSEENGTDDLKWYTAKKVNGVWTATGKIINHKSSGKYIAKLYAVPSGGSKYYITKKGFSVSANRAKGLEAEKKGSSTTKFTMKISTASAKSGVSKVQFVAWQKSDKSDLYTYEAKKAEDGSYSATGNISKHKYHYGTYQVCAVVTGANGVVTTTNPVTVSMKKPKQTTVAKVSGDESTVDITVNALEGYKNLKVKAVEISVWSEKKGQDDLKVYQAAKKKENVWTTAVAVAPHKSTGAYQVQSYVVLSNGMKYKMSETTFTISAPSVTKIKVPNVNNAKGTFQVQSSVTAKSGVKKVQVAVWYKSDKSDLKWHTAKRQKDGTYKATVHNKSHQDYYGTYNYRIKATDNNGNSITTKTKTYKLDKSKIKWTVKDKSSYTKKQIILGNVPYAENTKKVQFKVWSEEKGQNYTKTYTAKQNSDGSWYVNMKISDFKKAGKYHVTSYAVLNTGKQKKLGSKTFTVAAPSAQSVALGSANAVEGTVKITESIFSKAPVEKVQVVVWSQSNKSDKHTYTAKKGLNGQYSATINIKNHKYNYGKYYIYTYVTDKNGIKVQVDKRTKTITKPVPTMSFAAENNSTREIVTIANVPYGKRVEKVKYKVWSETNGQDDARWYTTNKTTTGQYTYTIPLINHIDTGKIRVDAYAYFTDGTKEKLLTKKFSIDLYGIAGTSNTDAGQLTRYYNANATYPDFYAGSDAPNIETFAQIYVEECAAEGIRAEVAFAQAMKETGFLRYGGRVPIEAYNFAGLGAIDSDVSAYATYGSVREGVRAQVQHLKAYANNEALVNPCVDGRFSLVARGTAPYVEWLGISENPYGKGWATAARYGYSLRDDYMAKLLRY